MTVISPGHAGFVAALALGCGDPTPTATATAPTPPAPTERAAPGAQALSGLCEASAVVPWEGGWLVGDNETEDRLHRFQLDWTPSAPVQLTPEIEDIEALAPLPQGLLVVGSQSRNKDGEARPAREQVMLLGHGPVRPDLSGCAPCEAARGRPPKQGGLSVEGAAWWQGALWLGVRSPLVDGQALLLELAGDPTAALTVARVLPVDLGGGGVRDLVVQGEQLWILGGPADATPIHHGLYRLDSPTATAARIQDLPDRSEGLAVGPQGAVVVTDGDGQPGSRCKLPSEVYGITLPSGPAPTPAP